MTNATDPPFQRDAFLDKPGIVGARWWQDALAQRDPMARRRALKILLAVGGVAVGIGGIIAIGNAVSSDDTKTEPRASLEMQKQYGWNFGATTEQLTFDGVSTRAFDRSALTRMSDDLAPKSATLRRFYVPTLFQSPTAIPLAVPEGDPGTVQPLKDALSPIFTPAMDLAYRRGKALASLFDGGLVPASRDVAVVVDLAGAEAVAFAAGAAGAFDFVFAFDNWPHPRGVVAAHQTLAAAAYFQPLFARHFAPASERSPPPMFVLDRQRLAPYTDAANQFDNRHVAKLPSVADLRALGAKHVLYVTPLDSEALELDDLNETFVAYDRGGLGVKMVAATAFGPEPVAPVVMTPVPSKVDAGTNAPSMPGGGPPFDGTPWFYGSSADSHDWFWNDYPWATPAHPGKRAPSMSNSGKSYTPRLRTTQFSAASAPGGHPAGFGMTPVVVAVGTGIILGALISRSGSWNRSSGGGWGGG